jgi:hypothetical protein
LDPSLNFLHGFLDSFSTYLFYFADFTDLFVLGENVNFAFLWKLFGDPFLKAMLSLFSFKITPLKFPNLCKKDTKVTNDLKFVWLVLINFPLELNRKYILDLSFAFFSNSF